MTERLSAEAVYQVLLQVETADPNTRKPAETTLKQWEENSTPGFLASLTEIIAKGSAVNEQIRLLACIVAKNVVGSSWRKTLTTREWLNVNEEEKLYLRRTLPDLLLSEPSSQVALQLSLFLSNIVRFDFPRAWPDILSILVNVVTSNPEPEKKYRAVITLKFIVRALQTKVTITTGFSIEEVQSAVKEAREMPQKVAEQFPLLAEQCKMQLQAFAQAQGNWQVNAKLAVELLSVLENSILLVPGLDTLQPGVEAFFSVILECSQAQLKLISGPAQQQYMEYYNLIAKCFYRNINCVLSAFEKHTMQFCPYLMAFVRHYAEAVAILPRDSPFFIPRKIRKLTRFLTMVMVCPFFRHQFWESMSQMLESGPTRFGPAKAAYDGLNEFMTDECMSALIESLIQNHLRLTQDEIDAWQSDPELLIKDMDATDSLHAYAEELLVGMFLRSPDQIRRILVNDVRKLQEHPQSDSDEIFLLLDACYRAIGVSRTGRETVVDINQWYDTELRSRIEAPAQCTLLRDRILLTRGLWLIRKFASMVSPSNGERIITGVLGCIGHSDLVVSMQAIMTLHSFLLLRQARSDGSEGGLPIGQIVKECFSVLPNLKETENRVHILDLVSQLIRIVGYKVIEPHLEEIMSYLPSLWSALPGNAQESGGEVRLQKSLVTLTSNMIQAIGPSALENPKVGELALALLQFTSNPRGQQALNMLDEGLQLWISILRATPSLAQPLVDLYPRLFEVLHPDVEPEKSLPILEAYILLGKPLVPQYIERIVHAIDAIIGRCEYEVSALAGNIIETLLLVYPDETPGWFLEPTLRRMTRDLVEGEAIDRINVEKRKLAFPEIMSFTQVLARIVAKDSAAWTALCYNDTQAQEKLLDRWLQCLASHSMEELFSTYASLAGLRQRKTISIALLVLIDVQNPVVCENATKVLVRIRTVVQQTIHLQDRINRFRELQRKSQLDRPLERMESEVLLGDPVDTFDLHPLYEKAVARYPFPADVDTPVRGVPRLPIMEQ